jgi:hypothetical protein
MKATESDAGAIDYGPKIRTQRAGDQTAEPAQEGRHLTPVTLGAAGAPIVDPSFNSYRG